MQRNLFEDSLLLLFEAYPPYCAFRLNRFRTTLAFNKSRKDGVHSYAGRSKLNRETLRQPDYAPLGCSIWRPQRISQASGNRRNIRNRAPASGLQHRHRTAGTVKCATKIDRYATLPVFNSDVLDRRRWTGNTRIVDQDIKSPKMLFNIREKMLDLRCI